MTNENYGLRNLTKIYNNAFASDIYGVYGAHPKLKSLCGDLPYHTALNCWMKGGEIGEEERRRLLYEYGVSKVIASKDEEDFINKSFPSLPSDNKFINRVLNNLCQVYNEEPKRYISINDNEIEDIYPILSEVRYDNVMNKLHKKLKLSGRAVVRPRFRAGKLSLQVLSSDQYIALYDDYGNMVEFYKPYTKVIPNPDGTFTEELRFEYWDKNKYMELEYNGNPTSFDMPILRYDTDVEDFQKRFVTVTEFEHNYNVIPYKEFTFGNNDGSEPLNDLYELVKTQLEVNLLEYFAQENYIFSANSIGIAINMGLTDKEKVAPGIIYDYPNISDEGMGTYPPSLNYETPETFFAAFQDLKQQIKEQAMKDMGLPSSLVAEDTAVASSGVAMKLDRKELDEMRKQDIAYLRNIDKELILHIIDMIQKDSASTYNINVDINNIEVSIDFTDMEYVETFEEFISKVDYKKNNGLLTVKDYVIAVTENETIKTDEEAIEYIKNNKEMFNQIGDANVSGTEERISESSETGTSPDETDEDIERLGNEN